MLKIVWEGPNIGHVYLDDPAVDWRNFGIAPTDDKQKTWSEHTYRAAPNGLLICMYILEHYALVDYASGDVKRDGVPVLFVASHEKHVTGKAVACRYKSPDYIIPTVLESIEWYNREYYDPSAILEF